MSGNKITVRVSVYVETPHGPVLLSGDCEIIPMEKGYPLLDGPFKITKLQELLVLDLPNSEYDWSYKPAD